MKRTILTGALLLGALLAYLLLWPTGMEPVAWTPPAAPELQGVYAPNEKLKGLERLAEGLGRGPEAVYVDGDSNLYTGDADGRVIVMSPGGTVRATLGTGGRPLGLTLTADGGLVVADAWKGLLHGAPDLLDAGLLLELCDHDGSTGELDAKRDPFGEDNENSGQHHRRGESQRMPAPTEEVVVGVLEDMHKS